jgi:predicted adenylyl cyclase CyaB
LASELELKAVVPDPTALRRALRAAGARETFRGMLRDRRLDRSERREADQVLRIREWQPAQGTGRVVVGWKGPVSVSSEGYKQREEVECAVQDATGALALFAALGYRVVQVIDRYVELHQLAEAVARLEWYPRMDVLVEIEGSPGGMERLIRATGLPRGDYVADSLAAFVARYEARTGRPAVLAESGLQGEPPSWNAA